MDRPHLHLWQHDLHRRPERGCFIRELQAAGIVDFSQATALCSSSNRSDQQGDPRPSMAIELASTFATSLVQRNLSISRRRVRWYCCYKGAV